jgi:ABC-2 type transport system ATP-binding protein
VNTAEVLDDEETPCDEGSAAGPEPRPLPSHLADGGRSSITAGAHTCGRLSHLADGGPSSITAGAHTCGRPGEEDEAEEPAVPAPVLAARGLGLHTRKAWVFRDLDLVAYPGELIALTGPPGGGRTSALLALAGNFRHTHGQVDRGRTALGLVRGVHEPEPLLTAREHLDERLRLLRPVRMPSRRRRRAHRAVVDVAAAALPFNPLTLARDLTPLERHLLMAQVALTGDPHLLAVDDADLQLTPAEQRVLADALRATGRAAIVTTRQPAALDPDRIVEITR